MKDFQIYENASDVMQELLDYLRSLDVKNVCLVTGTHSYIKSGADTLLPVVTKEFNVTRIMTASADVNTIDLTRLLHVCEGCEFDCFLAVGGGTVIDMAKLLAFFIPNPACDGVGKYLRSPVSPLKKVSPVVAIPLTAGTGSECTPFAVVYHGKVKYSVDFPQLVPAKSFLVKSFLKSLSQKQRAQTALDAFAQAVESFWNVNSTAETDQDACSSIDLMVRFFKDYVKGSNDSQVLEAMHRASHLAGKAIAVTRTTAPHALSYPLNSFFNIPHGIGVALTLGEFFKFNDGVTSADCNDVRGAGYVKKKMQNIFSMLGVCNAEDAQKRWRMYMKAGGISCLLKSHGVSSKEDLARIMDFGFNLDRMSNNPRLVNERWVERMLYRIKGK